MHEFSLMQSVLSNAEESAREAKAKNITEIRLVIGRMREVVPDAMQFAFEALSPGMLCEGAKLSITEVAPRSRCATCNEEYEHDRFNRSCPKCGALFCELVAGKELYIDAIEVELE